VAQSRTGSGHAPTADQLAPRHIICALIRWCYPNSFLTPDWSRGSKLGPPRVTETSVRRRLAAILAADVVGYSKMMGENEAGTLAAVRKLRAETIEPKIAEHRGRLFKTMGDGFFAEFSSIVNAVACAAAIQNAMAAHNTDLPEDRRLQLRIGVNLGDVVVEDDDLLGDGVNVAARLEGIASPGEIVVSSSAHDQVGGRLDLTFEDMGEQQLKNISRPVRVYRLKTSTRPAAKTATMERTKPSIAVLPFTNMSGDDAQEFFVDGLTEDIITDLSNVPGFFVIARNSTFAYKSKAVDVRKIAQELGVKYILEGSARRSAARLRINAQLIDAGGGGNHIWAERFDKDIVDIFEVQDEVTKKVVDAIARHLKVEVAVVVQSQHPRNLEAYDLCVKSRNLFSVSREANLEAEDMLEQALALDPDYAEAHWQLAMVRAFKWLQWGEPQQPNRALSLASAQAALGANPQDSNANWVMGYVLLNERRWDEARPYYEAAVRLNPNNAEAHATFANFNVLTGRPSDAVKLAERALHLNPQPPSWCYWAQGFALVANGQFDDAIRTLRRPEVYRTVARRVLAAALALSGQRDEASREARYFLSSFPGWRISTWMETQPFQHSRDVQFWVKAYRLAGLPD
jgi:adenylate cyclase